MSGRYFDDWQVGDEIAHAIIRTVTETDNVLISTLTIIPSRFTSIHHAAAVRVKHRPLAATASPESSRYIPTRLLRLTPLSPPRPSKWMFDP